MKRLLAILMAALMLATFAACSSEETEVADKADETVEDTAENTDAEVEDTEDAKDEAAASEIAAPIDILNTVWGSFGDDEKFPVMGGGYTNNVMDTPGEVEMTDVDALKVFLVCSDDTIAMIDGAASLLHGMMTNNFTAGAFHLADGADMTAFIDAMKANIESNQWLCGLPEKMVIVKVNDEYAVTCFGLTDVIDSFTQKLTDAYATAEIVVEQPIA